MFHNDRLNILSTSGGTSPDTIFCTNDIKYDKWCQSTTTAGTAISPNSLAKVSPSLASLLCVSPFGAPPQPSIAPWLTP